MAKKPDAAGELSMKMMQALEAQRAQSGPGYITSLGRLGELADAQAPPDLVLKAAAKAPLAQRAVVANKKSLSTPLALHEDQELFVASPQVLEFALEALYATGPAPWPLKKLSAQLTTSLRGPFEIAVGRQLAANALPDSVGVVEVRRKPALYLKRQPPPKPPAAELADRLVRVLEGQRRLGPASYPVRLRRLVELTELTPSATVLTKALSVEPFAARAVALVPKERDSLVALTEDLSQAAGHPDLLQFLLETGRSASVQAFSVADLKARLARPAQAPFAEVLGRQMEAETLPAGLGWIKTKKDRLLFRLEDVRGLPVVVSAPVPTSGNIEAAFEEAFARLDRASGSHNFVSLVDLRRALPFDRATFDAHLRELRESGRYVLGAAEGRHGITEEQRSAGITEEGALLLFVSR